MKTQSVPKSRHIPTALILLVMATLLTGFSNGRWSMPLWAWLGPVLYLRYARDYQSHYGYWALLAACIAAVNINYWQLFPLPIALAVYPLYGLVMTLPYLADRRMAPHFNGYAGTLIFPLAFVTLEVLYAAFSPFGSWGAAAYSQYGYLPLMQLVSVTGMPGIAFLVAWFAAVANWAWEHRREPDLRTAGLATYGGVVLAVLLCGYLRLNAAPPVLVIGTDGQILFEHVKYGGNFIEGSVHGDGSLQVANTPFGLLSATIWYDADFPDAIRQAGEAGAGLFVLPSNDWDTITPIHGYMAVYRAIENGISVVRETDYGLSLAADPYGRMLAQLDYIKADDRTLVAEVPTQHVNTIYLMGGYLFGWLVVVAFCLMATVALRRSSIARSATRASSGEPGYSA